MGEITPPTLQIKTVKNYSYRNLFYFDKIMSDDQNLGWALKNGDLDRVKELIESNDSLVSNPIDGRSPMHLAADYGQLEVLEYLASKGADLNAKDKHGISVILAAIWEGHGKCFKFLLEKGCSKDGTAPDGRSYLEAAETEEIRSLLK